MTQREKVLAGVTGGTFLVIVNFFVISFFTNHQKSLRQDLDRKQTQLKTLQTLIADRGLWDQRASWLDTNQPKLSDRGGAGVKLMEEVRETARRHEVLIAPENVKIGTPVPRDQYVSVAVTVETKGSWKALIEFLTELQGPQKFMVFENASLRKNASDPTQMIGQLTIARWYSPK